MNDSGLMQRPIHVPAPESLLARPEAVFPFQGRRVKTVLRAD